MNRLASASLALILVLAAGAGAARADGLRLRAFGGIYLDPTGVGLKAPEGVAIAGGQLCVADTANARIVRFTITGEKAEPTAVHLLQELPYPIRLAGTSKGDLFVLDGKLRRIGLVGPGGEFRGYVDLPAQAVPRALAVTRADQLVVLDVARAKVVLYGGGGKPERELALPMERGRFFSDVAVDAKGNLFVLDSVSRQIHQARAGSEAFEPFGESLREELDFGVALATDDSGRVFVADQNGGGIVILGSDGSFRGRQSTEGWKEGQLRYPSALAIDRNGRVFVADRGNNRVQVFAIAQ